MYAIFDDRVHKLFFFCFQYSTLFSIWLRHRLLQISHIDIHTATATACDMCSVSV